MLIPQEPGDGQSGSLPVAHAAGDGRESAPAPRRLRVLLSAFACEPYQGSEPEVGWQWAVQMARFHDVTVLTQSKNRANIERALAELRPHQPLPKFVYFDREPYLQKLRRRVSGLRIYCILWHSGARRVVGELHKAERFDLMHHVTLAAFRYPTAIWGHGVPTVWGPIGGIENFPPQLLPLRHLPSLWHELIRNLHNQIQLLPFNILVQRVAATTVTLASTREMQRTFEKAGFEVRVMPTIGLRTRDIPFRPRVPGQGPLKLLFVGNIIALKGVHLAVEALAQSGTDATLTLIGRGYFQAALERRANQLGIGPRVVFRGRLPREEVIEAYREFDALLFPSMHDTGGYACIEAMCQELPVICLDAGGPAIAVQEGSGVKVPIGSRRSVIAGLATAIRTYDQDRNLLLEHGRNARQVVLRNYDWDKKGGQLSGVYAEAVAKWDSTRAKTGFTGIGGLTSKLDRLLSVRGIVVTFFALFLIGLASFSSVNRLKSEDAHVVGHTLPGLSLISEASFNLSQSFNRMLLMLMSKDPEQRTQYRKEMEAFSKETGRALENYRAMIHESEDRRLFDQLNEQRKAYLEVRGKVFELCDQNRPDEAGELCRRALTPAYEDYTRAGDMLLEYNVRSGHQAGRNIMRISTETQLLVAVIGVILFVVGYLAGFFK